MATQDFNPSWIDVYNKSGGASKKQSGLPVRAGSGSEWTTFIRIPDSVKNAINSSSTPASLHMRINVTNPSSEIDIGHHRERNSRTVGAQGIPWYAYNETWREVGSTGWKSYQMSNWFMPQFLSGNVQGIVLYSYQGKFSLVANNVVFRVTGTWNTAPTTPSNIRLDKSRADISNTVRWDASSDAEGDPLSYEVQYYNGLSWSVLSDTQTDLTYTRDITDDEETSRARFAVRAYDGSLYSGWAYSPYFEIKHVPPVFNANQISYQDVNSVTVGITANNQHIIQNASRTRAYVNSSATGNDGKSIKRYIFSLSGQERTRSSIGSVDFNPLNAETNQTLRVTAEDSAGLKTTVSKTVTIIPYDIPNVQFSAQRVGSIADETVLKVSGSISPLNDKNSLQTTRYRYRQTNGVYTSWFALNRTISGTNFTATDVILNLPSDNEWEIHIHVADRVSDRNVYVGVRRGKPIMFLDELNDRIGIGKFPTRGTVDVDGTVYMDGKVMALGGLGFEDTRSIKDNPQDIPPRAFSTVFKLASLVDNPPERANSTYAHILNIAGWSSSEGSGGFPIQMSIGGEGISLRQGTSPTTWSPWTSLISGSSDSNSSITSGSNSNGRWIRFPDGTQICWNSHNHGSVAINIAWGSLYGAGLSVNNFPVSFTSVPTVTKSMTSSNGTVIMASVNPQPTTSHPGEFEPMRGTAATVSNLTTHYIAIGRWK